MNFEIINGNIADIKADAIVLPANSQLKEGRGASEAIFEAAGRKNLQKACEEIGHCEVGSAVPTEAFHLNADFIIHAVVPRWVDGTKGEYGLLSAGYLSALSLGDYLECESIAFPLLASGNNKFDLELAFQIAKESIEEFNGEHLKKAYLVIYGKRINEYLQSQGYTIFAISPTAKKNKRTWGIKLGASSEPEAENPRIRFAKERIKDAAVFMAKKENRRKVYQASKYICKKVLKDPKYAKLLFGVLDILDL